MDKRQAQIRERAGLEESRLNVEFIEFLKKYSTPALVVIAVAAGGFVAYQRYTQGKIAKIDNAFYELETVGSSSSPSPDSLAQVAADFAGLRAVPALAYLEAGDAVMLNVQRGVREGATVKNDGTLEKAEDALSDADRTAYLARAEEFYNKALQEAQSPAARMPIRIGALFGLAAIAESRGDGEGAKSRYEQIVKLTDGSTWGVKATIAKERMGRLDSLKTPVRVVSKGDLPKLPGEDVPQLPPGLQNLPPGVTVEPVAAPPFATAPGGAPAPNAPSGPQPQPQTTPPAPAPSDGGAAPGTPAPTAPQTPPAEPK